MVINACNGTPRIYAIPGAQVSSAFTVETFGLKETVAAGPGVANRDGLADGEGVALGRTVALADGLGVMTSDAEADGTGAGALKQAAARKTARTSGTRRGSSYTFVQVPQLSVEKPASLARMVRTGAVCPKLLVMTCSGVASKPLSRCQKHDGPPAPHRPLQRETSSNDHAPPASMAHTHAKLRSSLRGANKHERGGDSHGNHGDHRQSRRHT